MSQVREGYKQTKVGVIPFDWNVVKIKDISTIKSGATPLRSNELYFNNGQINWVKTRDLNNNYIINTEEQITEKALVETSVKLLPIDSILIAMYGGFGQIGRTGLLKIRACSNQALSSLELDKDISPRFILEYLNFRRFYWKRYAASSRKDPNITKRDIEVFPISLPPLKEQEKIAKILTAWDSAISKQEELIKVRQENKKGLMQKLLSGEIRFDGFNGEWEFTKLGELLEYEQPTKYLVSNTNYDDNYNIPVLTAGKTFILGYTNEEDGIFYNDLPVIIFDDFTTATKYVDFPFKAKSSAMKILKAKNDTINIRLIYEMIQQISYIANDHKRYWISEYQELEIKLPPLKEQQKIAEVLTLADQKIELLKTELTELQEQKKALMQKLLTGEIRVKV